jgi:hypothetical protein
MMLATASLELMAKASEFFLILGLDGMLRLLQFEQFAPNEVNFVDLIGDYRGHVISDSSSHGMLLESHCNVEDNSRNKKKNEQRKKTT